MQKFELHFNEPNVNESVSKGFGVLNVCVPVCVCACGGMCVKVSLIKLHLAGFMRDVSAFTTQRVLIRKRMLNRFGLRQRQWRNNSALRALSHMESVNR